MPQGCYIYQYRDSNKLVEEFMLLANMAVAHQIYRSNPELALLQRHVHPQSLLMEALKEHCDHIGLNIDMSPAGALHCGPRVHLTQDEVQKQASHCNDKKMASKRVQEMSTELFFSVFVRECGPLYSKAMVMGILNKSFDVLVLQYGVQKRIYCNVIEDLKSFNYRKIGKRPEMTLVWNPNELDEGTVTQLRMKSLTETWIPPQNTATLAALSSAYTFSHSPRESGRGGGTVSVTSPINLFIIVIYRPPGPLGNFLEEMDTLLSVFPSDSTPLTVLGDFNLPSDKLQSSGLLALLNSFSLSFNSCPPTHKEGNVLDLVFSHPSPATDMTVTPLHISDHHLVSFSITLPVLPKRNPQHLSLTRRNLHSISPSSVASCTLSSLPDHESFSFLPLDSATDTLLSSLSSTMDLLCPLSTIHKKNSSTAPWLSDVLRNNRRELRSAARKWKKSKLDTDLTSYRTLLSKFSLDVTSAKTSFYKEKLETSAQDPRKLHNIFSSLLNPPAPPSPHPP
ncbi:hypothetical protein QTP86_007006 [Hemibagrus guttatus]|nr:hypothetical protein QTP86_007006 [Hemibagrus guttatus]